MRNSVGTYLRDYIRNRAGVVAVLFGVTLPLLIGAVGMSLDLAQAYLVRERLAHAVDAAALAGAAVVSDDPNVIEEKVNDFIAANYPPGKVGFTIDVKITPGADTLGVEATARYDTQFMKVVGYDYLDVRAESEVRREVKAIEVALVMDVTGSMSTNNNIKALKDAAKSFVNTMFARTQDPEFIKIALVPFSTSVNVGRYGLGLTPDGRPYGVPFVNNRHGLEYKNPLDSNATNTTHRQKWHGCVLEGSYPDDVEDHDGPWEMYRYCRNRNDGIVCDTNTARNYPNNICPVTSVLPLGNNQNELLTHIDTLQASGNTYVNVGLVWGLRILSPEYPFMEGVEWSDPDWKKAVILMTDGDNAPHPNYSVYGPSAGLGISAGTLNNRVLDVCDELKRKGVLVYTITFYSNISNATKRVYRECATQPSMWYDAPTQKKLIEVYGTIARELSNLHITK